MKDKIITVGIPSYKAQNTIRNTLASVQLQSIKDSIEVIISNDDPKDKNGYKKIIEDYPELSIKEIDTEINGGPGIARKICLDNCKTPYITFIDADDVFATPYSLEHLLIAITSKNDKGQQMIMSQGAFLQECDTPNGTMFAPRNDVGHPWVFGRLYHVGFLRQNKINFTNLRAMEDGEFNAKIRLLVEDSPLGINVIEEPVYYWKKGSEHSITRTGMDLNNDIPIYNYGLCQLGSAKCFKEAIDFVKNISPFKSSLAQTATEIMVGMYFTYYECLEKSPMYAEQNEWTSQWFYHNCFKNYENNISDDILEQISMKMFAIKAAELSKFPELTFKQWFKNIKNKDFKLEEIDVIRNKLPIKVLEAERKTGVVGESVLEFFK